MFLAYGMFMIHACLPMYHTSWKFDGRVERERGRPLERRERELPFCEARERKNPS